jgi:hypothetical protein
MCISRVGRWTESLRLALSRVYEPTTRRPIPWLLTGDAALALQGVDVDPGAIEFRAISPYAVAYFAGFMRPYEVPANAATVIYRRGGDVPPSDGWRSNVHQRVVAWSNEQVGGWFGRWNVEGCPVEVLHLRGALLDPLASLSSEDVSRVRYDGMDVAAVPLEFLLAAHAARNDNHVTNRILHTMRASGYSSGSLQRALDLLPGEKASRLLRLLEIRLVAG